MTRAPPVCCGAHPLAEAPFPRAELRGVIMRASRILRADVSLPAALHAHLEERCYPSSSTDTFSSCSSCADICPVRTSSRVARSQPCAFFFAAPRQRSAGLDLWKLGRTSLLVILLLIAGGGGGEEERLRLQVPFPCGAPGATRVTWFFAARRRASCFFEFRVMMLRGIRRQVAGERAGISCLIVGNRF